MATVSELPIAELPIDFEKRSARLQAGEPMTVETLANELGVSYEFLAAGLAALFRAVAQSAPSFGRSLA